LIYIKPWDTQPRHDENRETSVRPRDESTAAAAIDWAIALCWYTLASSASTGAADKLGENDMATLLAKDADMLVTMDGKRAS